MSLHIKCCRVYGLC